MNRFHKANQRAIEAAAREAILNCLKKGWASAKVKIEEKTQELIIDGLKKEPAYSSILTGKLKTDFGLTDSIASGFLNNLEQLIKSKIKTYFEAGKGNVIATVYLDFLKMDLKEVFAIPEASYISESKRGSFEIEWADWLLLAGSRVVVSGFETSREGTSVVSRSGKGVIMLPSKNGIFRVDPAFAGNEQRNLLTRAALRNIAKIEKMFVEEVMRIFS